jgi:2,5-diketo-D-gluconate reductase A
MQKIDKYQGAQASSQTNPALPHILLNDGRSIPQLGFGVWQVSNSDVTTPVREAIEAGYRLIDTAQGYDNEEGVGRAIGTADVNRKELFVTTKLRTKNLGFNEAKRGCEQSLRALDLDYLDMLLIHWPAPALDRYVETWRAMIELKAEGLVRSIGVSNFLPDYIERIVGETGVKPVVNQIELHPLYQQRDVRDFHAQHEIRLEAYSPLGTGAVLKNPVIGEIAEKYGRSAAQVILRWHLKKGHIVIPKSVTPDRIRQNLDVFDFELDAEDMDRIARLDDPQNGKTGSRPESFNDLF